MLEIAQDIQENLINLETRAYIGARLDTGTISFARAQEVAEEKKQELSNYAVVYQLYKLYSQTKSDSDFFSKRRDVHMSNFGKANQMPLKQQIEQVGCVARKRGGNEAALLDMYSDGCRTRGSL